MDVTIETFSDWRVWSLTPCLPAAGVLKRTGLSQKLFFEKFVVRFCFKERSSRASSTFEVEGAVFHGFF